MKSNLPKESLFPLIITGMHRSNTSLIGKTFQNSGLYIGDDLMPASVHNKEGYFEDLDIVKLEKEIIASQAHLKNDWYTFSKNEIKIITIDDCFYQKARDLVKAKYVDQKYYGWKSPRSTLLLLFWKEIIPEAKFFFAFRHPALVVKSLVKRGDMKRFSRLWLKQVILATKIWNSYNYNLIHFSDKYPEDCIFLESPDQLYDMSKLDSIQESLHNWGVLVNFKFEGNINKNLLSRRVDSLYNNLIRLDKESLSLYEKLKAKSSNFKTQQ